MKRNLILAGLALSSLVACDNAPSGKGVGEAARTEERSVPQESQDLRSAREKLEKVIIPIVDFDRTSAEEATDFIEFKVAKIAPENAVQIVARRPRISDERLEEFGVTREREFSVKVEYLAHDFSARDISAWKLLERVASDNRMKIEWINDRIELRPVDEHGKSIEPRPLYD
jgi:hypothetical protein